MPAPIIAAGAALVPEVFRFFSGMSQRRQANRINPVNPGFVANPAYAENARILREREGNYAMPGYDRAYRNIGTSGATAFNNGVQGASSSGDILSLATMVNAQQQDAYGQLAGQSASGAQDALNQYLQANAVEGNELVRKNMYDLDEYNRQLNEKAALLGAGTQNAYNAGDAIANSIRYFTQPQEQLVQPGGGSGFKPLKSLFPTNNSGYGNAIPTGRYA